MPRRRWPALPLVAFTWSLLLAAAGEPADGGGALAADDECLGLGAEDAEHCGLSALQHRARLRGERLRGNVGPSRCGDLESAENSKCRSVVEWAVGTGRYERKAAAWYSQMPEITGVDFLNATTEDFQRLYFCAPPGGKGCGSPPCSCSRPPCDQCWGASGPPAPSRDCDERDMSIRCVPPPTPMFYKGQAWPEMTFTGEAEMHIFAIGDWGGLDGSLSPVEGRPPLVVYRGGDQQGPSVFPRTRWNKLHTIELCGHDQLVDCYNTLGRPPCPGTCGFVDGVDTQPQLLVASAMLRRAAEKEPQYILNVGDNFYWGGIEKTCGTPMDEMSYTAHHQFDHVFERVYQGKGLTGKPWLSVLGNHDWGGRIFNNGWDQQIAYTWVSDRWIMPAPYWWQHVEYPSQNFSVDIYMLDSNVMDAKLPFEDSEHNVCSSAHNSADATCSAIGGPASVESCPRWFEALWAEQQTWLEDCLSKSTATWQIAVTHFPCGHKQRWYKKLHQSLGLDLLVTGHRHDQELWVPSMSKNQMGGLTCFVTGGGGGITSEATPNPANQQDWFGEGQYGFYDLTISKDAIKIESINWDGQVLTGTTVSPR